MRVFVPVEDGPFDGTLVAILVPYRCGVACEHALRDVAAQTIRTPSPIDAASALASLAGAPHQRISV